MDEALEYNEQSPGVLFGMTILGYPCSPPHSGSEFQNTSDSSSAPEDEIECSRFPRFLSGLGFGV